jgi:hypothetical protein
MPPHEVYIETHLGGGAVIRNKAPVSRNIGIDADPVVLSQWPEHSYPHVETVLGDAVDFLRNFDFRGSECVYADPPYVSATRRRSRVYRQDYTEDDHVRLVETLKGLSCSVLISGYESDLYNDLLPNWNKVTFVAASHSGPRQEVVWLNYVPPSVPGDLTFLGENFREREQVKRRHLRLQSRIDRLSTAERALLGKWLARTYPEVIPDRTEAWCNAPRTLPITPLRTKCIGGQ